MIQIAELDIKGGSQKTYQLSIKHPEIKGSPRSQRLHVCGVNSAFRRNTSKEPLEALRPIKVTVPRGRLHAWHVNS